MSLTGLDKFSQQQNHGTFVLTAVVVILLVVTQEFVLVTWRSNLIMSSTKTIMGARHRGYKSNFTLNSAEHGIFPAHKC